MADELILMAEQVVGVQLVIGRGFLRELHVQFRYAGGIYVDSGVKLGDARFVVGYRRRLALLAFQRGLEC